MKSSRILFFFALLLICIPASATPNIIFTDWNTDHAYVGTFNITGSTPSDDWKFVIPSTETGIIYKLYSISGASVKDSNTSTSSVVLEASNLSDGQYYILQMIPNIEITKRDPTNVSCNSEFTLSNSTIATDISYVLDNVTSGNIYKIYDPSTLAIYGSGTAGTTNATINVTGLPDGQYRIAETGSERILFTYWNADNASCNGIFQIWNSTPVTNVRLVLSNVTPNTRYSIIEPLSHVTRGWGIASTNATIYVKGLQDGVYWIVGDSNSSFVNPVIIGVAFVGAAFVGASFINRWFQKRKGA